MCYLRIDQYQLFVIQLKIFGAILVKAVMQGRANSLLQFIRVVLQT